MQELIPFEYLRATLLFGIAVAIWAIMKLKHKYANVSLQWLEGIVEGYTINAGFWCVTLVFSIVASQSSNKWVLDLALLTLFTRFLGVVTFIEVSSTAISIFWGIEKQSNGRLDYRFHSIALSGIVALGLLIHYSTKGLPSGPATFP